MHRAGIAACALAAVLGESAMLAQVAEPPLRENSALLVKLPGGVEHSWRVELPAGQTAIVAIVQQQAPVGVVTALTAGGRELVEADLTQRAPAARNLLIPPETREIRIRPADHGSLERIFHLRVGAAHVPTDRDRLRMQAEQLLGEGERLFREQKEGYVDASLAAQEQSLVLWNKLADEPHAATVLLDLASIRVAKRDTKRALESSQAALDLWTGAHDRPGMAAALNEIAIVSLIEEQPNRAEASVARAIELARSSNDLPQLTQALMIDADVHDRQGHADQARAEYLEALQLAQTLGDRLAEADTLSYLSTFEHDHGRLPQATEYGERALAISREENDSKRTASCLVRLSNVAATAGDFRKAIAYGEEALPLLKNPSAPYKYGNALYNVAAYYSHLADFPTALKYDTEALDIFRKTGSTLGQGYTLSSLGLMYLQLGDDNKADTYYRQAAAELHNAGQKHGEAIALLSLGGIALRRREFSKAIQLEQQAFDVANDARLERLRQVALGDLAESYFEAGDFKASADTAVRKLQLIAETGYAEEEEEANALRQQGRAWRLLHQSASAENVLNRALRLDESVGSRLHIASTLYQLAALDCDRGRLREASSSIAKALDLFESTEADAGNAETRMLFAASHRQAYDLAIEVAMRQHDDSEAFALSERARTRTFVDLIRGARLDIRQGVDAALLNSEKHLAQSINEKQERLARALQTSHKPAVIAQATKEIDGLIDRYQNVQAEIRRTSPHYAELVEPHALSLAEVQSKLLNSRTAILEFWLGEEHSFGWLVTRTECRGFELPPRRIIEALARRAYSSLIARNGISEETLEQRQARINQADRDFAQESIELSHMLLGPLNSLPSARRLWVVSDGALAYLPFAALPAPGSRAPLVLKYQIVGLPSVSVLTEERKAIAERTIASRGISVFADPVFEPDDERVRKGGANPGDQMDAFSESEVTRAAEDVDLAHLPRLWFSRREAEAVAAFAPRGSVRENLDFDANRREAENPRMAGYCIIHFATHAFLDSLHPELSGLVLSMVNRSGEIQDGFLRLDEIYNLKLNADLVVLSGCQTALGEEVRSEGLIGLTRGFMYAGAPQILASLWGVRDQATAEFMKRFYEALLHRHLDVPTSLRAAQISMRSDPRWSQPYYWAAFTMQGSR